MRAARRKAGVFGLCELATPRPGPGQVLVEVTVAGVCRTDVAVAHGQLLARDPVVLGHEFSGHVVELGTDVDDLTLDAHVAVFPLMPNGDFLGVDVDGAFAEYVVVPRTNVWVVPATLSPRIVAYAEPVAAALALTEEVGAAERIFLRGRGRIASLVARLLALRGCLHVVTSTSLEGSTGSPIDAPAEGGSRGGLATALGEAPFDVLVDCVPRTTTNRAADQSWCHGLLRPNGRLLRRQTAVGRQQTEPPTPSLAHAAPQTSSLEPIWQERLVRYGSFAQALALLTEGRLVVDDFFGQVSPLETIAAVLNQDAAEETSTHGVRSKAFVAPNPACVA